MVRDPRPHQHLLDRSRLAVGPVHNSHLTEPALDCLVAHKPQQFGRHILRFVSVAWWYRRHGSLNAARPPSLDIARRIANEWGTLPSASKTLTWAPRGLRTLVVFLTRPMLCSISWVGPELSVQGWRNATQTGTRVEKQQRG
eukprot:2644231-Rhodomonas_salina.1